MWENTGRENTGSGYDPGTIQSIDSTVVLISYLISYQLDLLTSKNYVF